MFRNRLLLLLILSSLSLVARADEPLPPALEALQGKWRIDRVVSGGYESDLKAIILGLEVKGHEFVWKINDASVRTRIRTIDATTMPKLLDIEILDDANKGRTYEAIYTHNGPSLRICVDMGGGVRVRPTEFASPAETGLLLVEAERVENP